jgi:hypothetical protein
MTEFNTMEKMYNMREDICDICGTHCVCIHRNKINNVEKFYSMTQNICDICGIHYNDCECNHNSKKYNAKKIIEKYVAILESYDDTIVDEIIRQIRKNRYMKYSAKLEPNNHDLLQLIRERPLLEDTDITNNPLKVKEVSGEDNILAGDKTSPRDKFPGLYI